MFISSRTPEGAPNRCPVCDATFHIEPSLPAFDNPCPQCGSHVWFAETILGTVLADWTRDAVVFDMSATEKRPAIEETVSQLVEADLINRADKPDVVKAMLQREKLGSTGIGRGYAVPNIYHTAVNRLVAALGYSREGFEFNSLDGEPVHVMIALIAPNDRIDDFLQALERISRRLRWLPDLPS